MDVAVVGELTTGNVREKERKKREISNVSSSFMLARLLYMRIVDEKKWDKTIFFSISFLSLAYSCYKIKVK